MLKSPCLDCPRRSPGCHGICPVYGAFRAAQDAVRDARTAEYAIRDIYIRYRTDVRRRTQRRTHSRV